jgi:hypothetical protein
MLIDGKQYIAVHSGWGGDSRGMEATLNRFVPGEFPEVPESGSVWVSRWNKRDLTTAPYNPQARSRIRHYDISVGGISVSVV